MKQHLLLALSTALVVSAAPGGVGAQADLNDLEMAHVAVTASNIDIAYAHLALAFSTNPEIRTFAETMIRDHSAVNGAVADLAMKLGVQAQDNDMSRSLLRESERIKNEMSRLRGSEFDRYYAENELGYHQTVNGVVEDVFIPNIENAEVRQAFSQALGIFRGHERHAERMLSRLTQRPEPSRDAAPAESPKDVAPSRSLGHPSRSEHPGRFES